MLVTAAWVISPWPVSLRANSATQRSITDETADMIRQEMTMPAADNAL